MTKRLLGCVLCAIAALGLDAPDAATRFTQLRIEAKQAREKKDQKALLAVELNAAQFLHYSGHATEQLALTYGDMGDSEKAIAELRDFVAMGQTDENLSVAPQLATLRTRPEFKEILKKMDLNKTPIQTAALVVELHDPQLLPEDIDHDPTTKTFLVTSVLEKKIARISLDGSQTDFAKSPEGWPMMAIKIDRGREVVWATEVALDKFVSVPENDWGRSAVLCLRLKDGRIVRRIEGPPHSALGDMALTQGGDVIVADNKGGGLYRIRANANSDKMERVDGGDFVSPQTPVALPGRGLVFVPDYVRGVALLDMATQHVQWIETSRQHTLHGIDGLYLHKGSLIAVQNGSAPERVVRFHLDPEFKEVTSEEVIERATSTLGDPTHGVVVGDSFYYIANSGWDCMDEDGRPSKNCKMTPARIMRSLMNER